MNEITTVCEELQIYPRPNPSWRSGKWENEPDRVEWTQDGLKCRISRMIFGHLCGYVRLPKGHPFIGKDEFDIHLDVHGGITYANKEDDGFWIGFDCAHAWDISPGLPSFVKNKGSYKNINFVKKEIVSLVRQIKEFK